MKSTFIFVIVTSFIVSCNTAQKSSTNSKKEIPMEKTEVKPDLKAIATEAQNAFFNKYDADGVKKYFTTDYIQHNPHVPTGIEPVLGFLPLLKKAGTTSKTHRMLQDGNFIVMHNTYNNAEAFGAKELVTFDVWRMEDGKVAEHWDAVTPVVKETVSGRSQFDGPTTVTDIDKTKENKTIVENFVNDVLFGKNPTKITNYVSTEKYHQHNTHVGDGLEGLNKAIEYLISQNDLFIYKKTHKILGEGNFVLTMSEGEWHGKPQAFYDLFRLENGKIVEHWDVIQEIPEKMAHNNGMF
ncbi:Predicted SnoaL-like aldol condensation-catalyzing enzyme [Tenacibaculum sp. 190524A02b]|uniref:Predicted SnoaL-like aldol condensation-catalyzing enzyme n=2 Tax=Tenacibaculum vairaonense TaxID=3137860 RepID=A0ABM9PI56_9FLAO